MEIVPLRTPLSQWELHMPLSSDSNLFVTIKCGFTKLNGAKGQKFFII